MKKTEKGYTNVRNYDTYASYNADTERNDATISFIEQDNSVWVRDKQYSMNAECFVGSQASGISTTGNWFLCGEATITNARDVNIIGIVQQSVASGACGIFVLGLRGYSESASKFKFSWICKTRGTIPLLRVVINGHTVKLYCKVYGGQYQYAHIRLLDQCNQYESKSYKTSFFTLKDSTTIIPEADVPSGTDIADVPYITTTDANNKFLPVLATTSLVRNNPNVGYVKFAEIDTKGQFGNKAIILAVSTTFVTESNWNDGLYMLNIRGNGTSAPTCRACCFVQYKVSVDKIKLYYAVSGSKVEFYREVRTAKELTQLGFKILNVENFENGSLWDFKLIESSKTTSDATLDTPIGALTEIPNRGHVYFADNAEKVLQTNSVLSKERRVLLGEDNDNTQQDNVCKSENLTFNPRTKTLTVPTIKNPNGSWVHAAEGVAGQSGYVKIATIKINAVFTDLPLTIQFTGRSYLVPVKIYIRFYSENNTDPTLASFYYESGSTRFGEYLHKSAAGTWDLYIKKGQSWDKIVVLSCENPYAFLSPNPNYSITWQDELVTTLPTDYVESIMSTKRIHVSGNANSATKLVTARKIGFANFDGTADVSLNAIQGANVTRWSSSGTLKPNQWIRLMRMKFNQTYSSVSITLAIEEGEQHRFRGIINFTAWVGSNLTPSVNNSTAVWYSLYQADKNSFGDVTQYIRMVPVAPTDNDANGYVDVYVMSPLGAISYGWHIINDRQINNASFTLKADVTSIIDNENFPTSYKSSGFQGVLTTGENVEYSSWVTKATNATNADVANKTKYPIVFKRNGASITNWFADTTFTIDIPEELLGYSAPTGIALKVPEIDVAKEAKKVANKLSLTVNGSTTEYDGSAGARVSIKANCTHIVKANSNSSLGILYPEQTGHPSAVTVPVSILPLEPYNSAARGLNDGDTLILHIPNSMSNPTANYVWCVKLDITKENTTDNIIPLIHGQSAGTPAFWNTSTTIPAGFYQFVYSATLGGLVYMYRNTSTT